VTSLLDLPFSSVSLTGVKTGFDKLGQPVATVTIQLSAFGEQIGRLIDMATLGPLDVCFAPQSRHLTATASQESDE
jgi:hypothetical protein